MHSFLLYYNISIRNVRVMDDYYLDKIGDFLNVLLLIFVTETLCSRRRPNEDNHTTFKEGKQSGGGLTSPRVIVPPNRTPLTDSGPPSQGFLTGAHPVNLNPVNVQCTCGAININGLPLPPQQRPSHKHYCHCVIYGTTGRPMKRPTPCDSSSGDNHRQDQVGRVTSNGFTTFPPRPTTHTHGGRLHPQQFGPNGPPRSSSSNLGDMNSTETYYVPSALPGHVNNPRSHRSRPHWSGSTFGRPLPLTVLGRVEETDDGVSDSSSTTTSGSFDVDPEPSLEQHIAVDTVGKATTSPINTLSLRSGSQTNMGGEKSNITHSFV